MVGNICDWPPFWTFNNSIGSLLYAQLELIAPLLLSKNWFVTFSSIDLKLVYLLSKSCHLITLKHFVPIFFLIFDLVDPHFHCSLIFLTPHFSKTRSNWIHFVLLSWPPYQNLCEVHPLTDLTFFSNFHGCLIWWFHRGCEEYPPSFLWFRGQWSLWFVFAYVLDYRLS